MKHVFVIGSHSPYLTALGTIKYLNLPKNDVIFLFGRHYNCVFHDTSYKTIDISDEYLIYFRNNTKRSLKTSILNVDKLIDDEIKDEYTLYVPHLRVPYHQILSTNEKCCDIKFIQEGIIDFCSHVKPKEAVYSWIINTFILQNKRMWKTYKWNSNKGLSRGVNISETFAITDKIFTEIDTKHTIVKWPTLPIGIQIEKDSSIFVFESAVEMGLVTWDIFLEASENMIRKCARQKNYVKFHPFQSKENKEKILSIFDSMGLSVEVLSDDIPFEIVMSSFSGLNIYGFTTSLIFYAFLLGHNAVSFAPSIVKTDKMRRHWDEFCSHLLKYGGGFFVIKDLEKKRTIVI